MGEIRQLARRRPDAELLLGLAAAHPAILVEVLGLGGNEILDARRQAAESRMLLIVTVDLVDPSVRIEIAYGLAAGGERDFGNHLDEWRDDGR